MRIIFVPAVIALLIIGWFISAVMAGSGCGDLQSPDDPCTEGNAAFSVMLPYISNHEGQEGENPQNPASTSTSVPTPAPTSLTPPSGSPQPGVTPSSTPPFSTATPSSPTSSIPPTPTTGTPSPTNTPSGTATPTTQPQPLFTDPPMLSSVTQEGNGIGVSWSGCGTATSARLLYGPATGRPNELSTTSNSLVTPNVTTNGTYQVTVECYDELGNSVFSTPALVEISGLTGGTQ